ncbi:MAG: pyridoxal phosphate-dependent aminotransferase [Candidatus Omnitrophica bacterium]|nr:pyridoxal phosphate-dependent aminotransferase [Candidatus Omnitrophota bacterium]
MTLIINKRIQGVAPSSTLAITARAKELRVQGCDVVNFAGGEPDFDTPDAIKKAAIQAMEKGQTKYTPSIGTPDLRKAIAEKFKKDNQLKYDPAQIAVSCGAKHSLYCIIQVLVDAGDEVLIPSPYWVSYPEMVKLAGGTPVFVPTTVETNLKVTPELLNAQITANTKVLILNSPSNPTGMLYRKDELTAIVDVCLKNNIYIISDEIYEKLIYDTTSYTSVASLSPEAYENTITVNGVSKAFSMTGWRIGYCAGKKEIIGFIKKFQDHSTSNPCSISQAAALEAIKSPEKIITAMRDKFKSRRELIMSGIDAIDTVSYIKPEGAFYLFCDVSKLGNSMDVAKRILDEVNVAMIPGEGFGAPGFVRLSFATSAERIKEGTKRIADWVKKNA